MKETFEDICMLYESVYSIDCRQIDRFMLAGLSVKYGLTAVGDALYQMVVPDNKYIAVCKEIEIRQ